MAPILTATKPAAIEVIAQTRPELIEINSNTDISESNRKILQCALTEFAASRIRSARFDGPLELRMADNTLIKLHAEPTHYSQAFHLTAFTTQSTKNALLEKKISEVFFIKNVLRPDQLSPTSCTERNIELQRVISMPVDIDHLLIKDPWKDLGSLKGQAVWLHVTEGKYPDSRYGEVVKCQYADGEDIVILRNHRQSGSSTSAHEYRTSNSEFVINKIIGAGQHVDWSSSSPHRFSFAREALNAVSRGSTVTIATNSSSDKDITVSGLEYTGVGIGDDKGKPVPIFTFRLPSGHTLALYEDEIRSIKTEAEKGEKFYFPIENRVLWKKPC